MSTRPRRAVRPLERPHLRVVRGRGARRSPLVPAAVILVLAVFAVAALQAFVAQEGLRVNELERSVRKAEERHALLRAEIAELSSPERIERAAADLGLDRASDPVFLRAPAPMPDRSRDVVGDPSNAKRLLAGRP